ncbi:hypothetical protein ACQ4PT_046364 [Festuca glaucescens]
MVSLYCSVDELDETYICRDNAKDALLTPAGGCSQSGKLLQLPAAKAQQTAQIFQCNGTCYPNNCRSYVTMVDGTLCPYCGAKMSTPAQLVQPSASAAVSSRAAGAGFVQGVAYTVMDDLKVAPMSTISGITLLNTFGITDISSLQEKTVQLGYPERPDPFKLLLTETNIGLNSSEIKMTSTEKGSTASKLSMKLLVNSKSHRVLYAEAGKDVVDFLFSLLTLPLAGRRGQHHGRLRGHPLLQRRQARRNLHLPRQRQGRRAHARRWMQRERQAAPASCGEGTANSTDFPAQRYLLPKQLQELRDHGGWHTMSILRCKDVDAGAACAAERFRRGVVARCRGRVRAGVAYTVMDDLKVAPMSTISGITLLNTFGITDIGSL